VSATHGAVPAGRVSEVLARLAIVNDPELDESVVELDFITKVTVDDGGTVDVSFRLPTYWCAANFAFLMAEDMRSAIAALPWVARVNVTLGEHMYSETINRGMAEAQSFQAAFGAEADGSLAQVRRTFLVKAFQRRQVALADHLVAAGHEPEMLAKLSIGALPGWTNTPEGQALARRYLDRRPVVGDAGEDDPAFVDEHGAPVAPEAFRTHLRAFRRVAVNVEFNGALCRGLLAARFEEKREDEEPTLLDFIRAVPPEKRAAVG
jgi:metal-sulfur cluster biosynthetic enzyme